MAEDASLHRRGGLFGAASAPLLAWAAFLVALAAGAGAILLFGNPRAADPVVLLDLKPAQQAGLRRLPPPPLPAQAQTPQPRATATTLPPKIVPAVIDKPVYADHALVADPALLEQTAQGPLPKIADDGRTPMQAYAPVVQTQSRIPIAVVIGGLGISAKATASALSQLPAGITLSFAPYSDDAQRWVSEARRLGHEVLLEVPMEPYDFPDSDPGQETLRAGGNEMANIQRLVWAMTRFTGYAGVTNLLGGRFMSDPESLSPVMTFVSRRGLLFFDNGSAARSAAPDVARSLSAPFVQSAVTLDNIQTAMEIDARLSELESRARNGGAASGVGFVYPVTLDRVAQWSKGLGERGFVLVPASALVSRQK